MIDQNRSHGCAHCVLALTDKKALLNAVFVLTFLQHTFNETEEGGNVNKSA